MGTQLSTIILSWVAITIINNSITRYLEILGHRDSALTRHFDVSAATMLYYMPCLTHQHASRGSVLGVITKIADLRVSTIALIGIFEVKNL